ncbi:hypothetical protein MRX96_016432 [Rhipicephalus microplus]
MFLFDPSSTSPHRALLLAAVPQRNLQHNETRAAVTRHRSGGTGNRESLYVIISELGVSIPVCACVLTYSFANYTRSKRNAEEFRQCIASTDGVHVTPNTQSDNSIPAADAVASSVQPPLSCVKDKSWYRSRMLSGTNDNSRKKNTGHALACT